MRPDAVRPILLAAVLLTTPAAVRPAEAVGACLFVTGTAVLPGARFSYWPGVTEQPEAQEVSVLPFGSAEVALTCERGDGAAAFEGTLGFDVDAAHGASFAPEDLTNGAGSAGGLGVTGAGVSTLATTDVGTYGLAATATATVSFTYVRAGATLALVTTLHDLVVDPDGAGAIPGSSWGDVPLATATPLVPDAGIMVYEYLFGYGLRMYDFDVPQSVATAAGT